VPRLRAQLRGPARLALQGRPARQPEQTALDEPRRARLFEQFRKRPAGRAESTQAEQSFAQSRALAQQPGAAQGHFEQLDGVRPALEFELEQRAQGFQAGLAIAVELRGGAQAEGGAAPELEIRRRGRGALDQELERAGRLGAQGRGLPKACASLVRVHAHQLGRCGAESAMHGTAGSEGEFAAEQGARGALWTRPQRLGR
jgi:hypothetical protein